MAEKILGLDIGSYSIKMALFEATFRSCELIDLYESKPFNSKENDPQLLREAKIKAIQDLFLAHPLMFNTVVSALNAQNISVKALSLPLAHHQIDKVLPFELEGSVPFEIQDVIVDHYAFETSKNKTRLLAVCAPKKVLAEHLDLLKSCQLEAAFVGMDSACLVHFTEGHALNPQSNYILVDIGHQKTNIAIVIGHKLRFVRTLFLGGLHITNVIRKDLDLTYDQAQEVKHQHGIVQWSGHQLKTQELQKLSLSIQKVLSVLCADLRQTMGGFFTLERNENSSEETSIEHVYLCGGSSQIKNIEHFVQEEVQIPCSRLSLPQDKSQGMKDVQFVQAISLGLRAAVRGSKAKSIVGINFRKNEFAFAKDLSDIKEKAFFFGRWVIAVFVLSYIYQFISMVQLKSQKSRFDKMVVNQFLNIVPDTTKKPKNANEALRELNAKISQYTQKEQILTSGLADLTALDVLKEVSALIPNEIALDTQELSIDKNKITVRGMASTFEDIDQIISSLKAKPEFSTIDIGDRRESADQRKTFALTITIEDPNKPKDSPSKKKGGK